MEYRRLGSAGLKVSVLSLGSWVTYGKQVDVDAAAACMKAAWDEGVNFFDNAEAYEAGKSEEVMGAALRKLGWRRAELRRVHEDLLRDARRGERADDAQPQEAPRGHRRGAEALRPGLHRPGLLPPPRPRDTDGGDGLVHAHDGGIRERPCTGEPPSGTRTSSWRRGPSPRSTTCTSRRWSSRSTTCSCAAGWRRNSRGCTRSSGWASPPGARWPPAFSPASTTQGCPRTRVLRLPGYEWLLRGPAAERRRRRRTASFPRSWRR